MVKLVFGLYGILALSSCNKIMDSKSDTNIDNTAMYSDDLSATAALIAYYSEIMKAPSIVNGSGTRFPGMYGDELERPFTSSAADNYFLKNELQPNNTTIKEIWNASYYHIYIGNTTLENIARSKGVSPQTKKQLEGEAKFLRALTYFYLVNYFGDVPLVLSTNTNETKNLPRAKEKEVYAQIKSDLLDAVQLLPVTYPGKNESPTNRIRANKGAAAALLARVYLYLKDYPNAILQSSWVISCGAYKLENNLDNVFLPSSNETIMALYPTNTSYNTYEGKIFNVKSTKPPFVLTDNLVKSFDSKDSRAIKWMRLISGTTLGTVKAPYKYKVYESDQVIEYNVILRLAEMHLIRAEANAFSGNKGDAISDLNIIRNRAGVDPLQENLNADKLKTAIEEENQHEFFAELGHRFLDLKRWPGNSNSFTEKNTRADDIIRANKLNWEPYKLYWPIPRDEILRSPALTQNTGYSN